MSRKTIFIAISLLVAAGIVLGGCGQPAPEIVDVEKTVVLTQEVLVEGDTVVEEVVVTATPEPVEEEPPEERTLVVCLGGEAPDSMYWGDSILHAVYDGPIDRRSYGYQAVILEKLPSLADGDAVVEVVAVADGDSVVGDDNEVYTLEAGVVVRPAGCRAADCAITYEGGGLEMERMAVTYKLLPGLTWSDGIPLTASDSVYAFNFTAPGQSWEEIDERWQLVIERTASYQALDEVTVVWTGLPGYMDPLYVDNFWSPRPEHLWGEFTADEVLEGEVNEKDIYIGWGAYILDEWVAGEGGHITLHRNPNYYRAAEGLPRFDHLVYRFVGDDPNANIAALLSGECDIAGGVGDQVEVLLELEAAGLVEATFVTSRIWEQVGFNIFPYEGSGFAGWDEDGDGLGPFGDVRLRRAVAMCMDRQAVNDKVYFGQSVVMDTFVPPEHPLNNQDAMHYDFDVEAASALLDEIGWIDEDDDPATPRVAQGVTGVPDGTPLEFTFETTSTIQRQQLTQVLAESMAQCGVKVNLGYYTASEMFFSDADSILYGRRFDLCEFALTSLYLHSSCTDYHTGQITGPPDEINPFTGELYKWGWWGWNATGYSSPEYDAACNAAIQSLPGEDAYVENTLKAQEIFARDLPVVPLVQRLDLVATRPDICNYILDPTAGDMWNIEAFDYGPDCGE